MLELAPRRGRAGPPAAPARPRAAADEARPRQRRGSDRLPRRGATDRRAPYAAGPTGTTDDQRQELGTNPAHAVTDSRTRSVGLSSRRMRVAFGSGRCTRSTRRSRSAPAPIVGAAARPGRPRIRTQARDVFRSSVDLVTTDVIVRDNAGQFVADLKKDEFEVFEDGVKQEVVSFMLTHGGRTINVAAPPPPPVAGRHHPAAARPTNDASGRIFLIFVDDLHLDFRNTGRIRELFKKIAKELIHEGDMFGIVSTGPSSISIDMTYDRKRLDEAINKISGAGLKPKEIIEAPRGRAGAARSALPRARGVLDRLRHHAATSSRCTTAARRSSTSATATTSIRSRRRARRTTSGARTATARSNADDSSGDGSNQSQDDTNPFAQAGQRVRRRGSGVGAVGADARRQPRQRHDLHHRPARPGRRAGPRRGSRHDGLAELRPRIAEQPARARRADRRLSPSSTRTTSQGAQAHRPRRPATTTCSATTRAIRTRPKKRRTIEVKVDAVRSANV